MVSILKWSGCNIARLRSRCHCHQGFLSSERRTLLLIADERGLETWWKADIVTSLNICFP